MKNILIYFPDTIIPLTMANRVRVIEKIKYLSTDSSVTFLSICDTVHQKNETLRILKGYCNCEFIFRPKKKSVYGALLRIQWKIFDYFGYLPYDYTIFNGAWVTRPMKKLFSKPPRYDAVICDYWYGASSALPFFKNKNIVRIVDTHNVLSDQKVLELDKFYKVLSKPKWLARYKFLETKYLKTADVIFAVSKYDYDYYKANFPGQKSAFIRFGVDLERFRDFNITTPENKTVLFYASLGSDQNQIAFFRLWNNIFPLIKKKLPETRLLVVGTNPGVEILKLNELDYVTVTGFVENPLQFICKARIHFVPMETASGFRGRIPEVMGIGIPTIGTHNALDCLDLEGVLNEFVNDDDNEMAELAIKLLQDDQYWKEISDLSKNFIHENYSLQKTYSQLYNYL